MDGSCWANRPWLWNPVQGGSWQNAPGLTTKQVVKAGRYVYAEGHGRWGRSRMGMSSAACRGSGGREGTGRVCKVCARGYWVVACVFMYTNAPSAIPPSTGARQGLACCSGILPGPRE